MNHKKLSFDDSKVIKNFKKYVIAKIIKIKIIKIIAKINIKIIKNDFNSILYKLMYCGFIIL